jgi:hypothetical protein
LKKAGSIPAFAVCLDNSDYPASLELHKIYRVLPDPDDANDDGDLRIIDESGYLYPARRFAMIEVPKAVGLNAGRPGRDGESGLASAPGWT